MNVTVVSAPDLTDRSALEALLRAPEALDEALRDGAEQPAWLHRMLLVSLVGLGAHGLLVGAVAQSFIERTDPLAAWLGPLPFLTVPLAVVAALSLALAVSLPSLWFYTQLAGFDVSLRWVAAQATRVQAHTAALLLGVLPIYAAVALGGAVGLVDDANQVVLAGLAAPFALGLVSIRALHRSFARQVPVLPATHARRGNILLRLVLCWGAIFGAVAPLALFRIGGALGGWLS
jgi:hypothetical protein